MAFLRDRSIFCIPESVLSFDERQIIGGICIFTASLGFTGAALQLRSLKQFRNRQRRQPSPNPNIIFYLALSDLIACAGKRKILYRDFFRGGGISHLVHVQWG